MVNIIFWVTIYTFILALSQVILKMGLSQIGAFNIKSMQDVLPLALHVISNLYILIGTALMASSFFLWLAMLSWFKLSLIFPLTAFVYVFVALLSYFLLYEKLMPVNYFGVVLIALGIFFLLYKQV